LNKPISLPAMRELAGRAVEEARRRHHTMRLEDELRTARVEILKVHARGIRIAGEANLETIAARIVSVFDLRVQLKVLMNPGFSHTELLRL